MIVAIVGVIITTLSVVGGLLLASRNAADQERQTKVLAFVLFFWVLVFVQLLVVAIGYWVITS